jgi:glycosyltransferase involved in cell wall biosynthesis
MSSDVEQFKHPIPVLLMSHSLGHGGGERQLALTALSMDRSRFEPHVASCEGGFWVDRLREAGVPRFIMGPRSLISFSALREARRLRAYIRDHGIRIVQTFDYTMNVLGIPPARTVPGVIALSNLRCHMTLIPQRYRWLNHVAHRISAGIVVNSEALRRHLADDYSIPTEKVFTCYNGIDTAVFHRVPRAELAGLEGASLVIGTVCVLRPEKNLPLLLEAFQRVGQGRPDIRLLITGSGPEEPTLRALTAKLNIAGQTVFHPSTPDVARVLSAVDVFVLPSLNEGLSNALMEAMACGCCAVASAVGGNPELISDGTTGLLFPSEDLSALVEKLEQVVENADLRRSLASAGAEKMSRDFSLAGSVLRMMAIYDLLMTRKA